ncbi:hypothetical protein H0H10_08900 [Streptomyces sp. TRM S81-3]|uniref:Uncharacterized protein n=1 Tax=Streptomyces griseicoloratus TaxID=2752516 RepID=A0A926QQ70_9ACTN|nr:hypothetical protein [Streptomyces griseicoloratus]MBD0419290.1 hypothetical protein [Streptomyces griseicoloratus]
MTTSWYALLEEGHIDYERAQCCYRPQWEMRQTEHVEGSQEDAQAAGLRMAKTHIPESFYLRPGDRPHRSVFATQAGTWVVQLKSRQAEAHFRVTVGQLVHTEEELGGSLPEWFPEYSSSTWSYLKFLLGGSLIKKSKA